MALPAENTTQAFVQAWKERTGKPMRKPGMPVLPTDVLDDGLLECAMRCNHTFRSIYKDASRDIYEDFCLLATSHNHGKAAESFVDDALSNILLNDEPLSRLEALKRSDWKLWFEAEIAELNSMKRLEVFETMHRCDIPNGKKAIKQKWVYKQKPDRKKARLVAKGFMQSPWDIGETYAPVTRLSTVRTLLAIAAGRPDWSLRHLDISTAFINAKLKEEVYMELPDGYRACEHCGRYSCS